jgi:hypothetical protein
MEIPLELPELVEELLELVDPKMTRQNGVTTSKLLEVLMSQPQTIRSVLGPRNDVTTSKLLEVLTSPPQNY